MPALRGVVGTDISRQSVTGSAAALSLYAVPTAGRDACPQGTRSGVIPDRDVAPDRRAPGTLSRRHFRSRWALLRGLIRLFLPFRGDGQDQPTQERPLVFVFVINKWRSQRRWNRHDRLSTRRVIDEPPPTAES